MKARLALWLAPILAWSQLAQAEPGASDRALATELFVRGRELLEAGRVAEACAKLEASQQLDPSGGTILNLALCHERLGKTATAWSEFAEALSFARRDHRQDRADYAHEHLTALAPNLARLTIDATAPLAAGVRPGELAIRRDGSEIPRAAWGEANPLDPGAHVIEVTAPGHTVHRVRVTVAAGESARVALPALSVLEASPIIQHRPVPMATYAFGLASVAALSVAGVASARAIGQRRASDDACVPVCTADGVALNERAGTAADVATVSVSIAGVAALAAVYFWLTRPTERRPGD